MPNSPQPWKAHLAINVRNVSQIVQFYRRLFGVEPSRVREGYAKFDLANPPLNFTLNQMPFHERGALSHLGIQLASTEDVLVMRARWMQQGLLPRDQMQTNCCGALQDKTWVADPDGNEWEAFVVLQEQETGPQETIPLDNGPQPSAPERTREATCCAHTCCLAPPHNKSEARHAAL